MTGHSPRFYRPRAWQRYLEGLRTAPPRASAGPRLVRLAWTVVALLAGMTVAAWSVPIPRRAPGAADSAASVGSCRLFELLLPGHEDGKRADRGATRSGR